MVQKRREHLVAKAIKLRNKGYSVVEISEQLGMPRTSVYECTKHIPLQRPTRPNTIAAAAANKKKYTALRDIAYNEWAGNVAKNLLQDFFYRDFCMLFLTEGHRKSRNTVQICNSNPMLVRMGHAFISKHTKGSIRYYLQYHVDQDPRKLMEFWSEQLSIEPDQIKVIRKSNSGNLKGRNWTSKYGVLSVEAGDTYLRCKVQALMDAFELEY